MGREQWGTRAGFIFAAVGSAIGLGNIWRFPYVAYDNGGGAFLIPYFFALLTAGIPLLILEFTLGQKYRGSAPLSFARLNKRTEWIGWWQVAISFVISTYYSVIIAWAIAYTYFSFGTQWGDDTGGFLFGNYLKLAENPGEIGGLQIGVFVPLIIVWIISFAFLYRGVKRGIELANRIFIPLLVILMAIIVIRGLTLPGAIDGLNHLFTPNWSEILNAKTWVAAYGQIFFSLSIAFAIMITYSSYLPKKSDINTNAFITGFANSGFELFAAIGVFSVLGFMAQVQGVGVGDVASAGVGLAFVVFPQIINELPASTFFGVLFFLSLVFAGLSSLISIVETFVAGISDKFNMERKKSVIISCLIAFTISILFATSGGLYLLDVVDYFVNNFGIALAGLVEVLVIAWFINQLKEFQSHSNGLSDVKIGSWWIICLKYITPVVLGYMMINNILTNIRENYEGYPTAFILMFGVSTAALIIIAGFVLQTVQWKKGKLVEEDINHGD